MSLKTMKVDIQKSLRTDNPEGEKISLYKADNEQEEAQYVVKYDSKVNERGRS